MIQYNRTILHIFSRLSWSSGMFFKTSSKPADRVNSNHQPRPSKVNSASQSPKASRQLNHVGTSYGKEVDEVLEKKELNCMDLVFLSKKSGLSNIEFG